MPTAQGIETYAQRLAKADPETPLLLEEESDPDWSPKNYFLYQALDSLQSQTPFETVFESHSDTVLKMMDELGRLTDDRQMQSGMAWMGGNFSEALKFHKSTIDIANMGKRKRDAETVEDLRIKTKKLLGEKEGGSIFILYGGAHGLMIDDLQRKFRKNPVQFSKIGSYTEGIPLGIIDSKGSTDDDLAQDLLATEILALLTFLSHEDPGRLLLYAKNFETVHETIKSVATSFSLEEIKGICEEKQDLLKLLQNHPLAEPIWPIIKEFLS